MAKYSVKVISVRLPDTTRTAFIKRATKFGGMSEVLREMIDAFIDNRIKITPPPLKGIYK